MWITLLSNNETAQPARRGLKLITAREGWAHMLGYSCLLIAVKISLSVLSVLTVISRYIRCTALNWVELILDCDVV